jgi:hypothetical protein
MSNTKDNVSLSQQKLDLDEVRIALESKKSDLDYRIKVLKRGMEEIDNGEDMHESGSILAQEVRNIMRNPLGI